MTWSVARFVRAVVAVVVRFGTLVLAVSAAMILVGSAFGADNSDGLWLTAGESPTNTRWQPAETRIGVGNAGQLAPDWTFTTGGDVSATPAVDGNTVYVPDFAGNLFAIDKKTGMQKWSHSVSDYTGIPGDLARATPAVAGNKLILGDQGGRVFGGANVFAVGKQTGTLLWKTQVGEVGDHPFEIVTSSAVMSKDNKVAYVGVASYEEVFAAFIPGYECCHDRGAIVALSADTGEILWKTYTVPNGFSGGAVWGSTPVIDESRNSLYVGTGNNYSVPQVVIDCVVAAGDDKAAAQACNPPDNHFDSIMALDLKTGAIKWSTLAIPYDAWNVGCIPFLSDGSNCPEPAGPDYDFGQGPTLFTVGSKKDAHQLLGIGQKSGQYWALDPQTGAVVWTTQVGPGGVVGGLQCELPAHAVDSHQRDRGYVGILERARPSDRGDRLANSRPEGGRNTRCGLGGQRCRLWLFARSRRAYVRSQRSHR
jgi:polyvinyl alcohol dehydrogenase (cytochrome)